MTDLYTGHRLFSNKTFAVSDKTSPRSDLRWKPTVEIFSLSLYLCLQISPIFLNANNTSDVSARIPSDHYVSQRHQAVVATSKCRWISQELPKRNRTMTLSSTKVSGQQTSMSNDGLLHTTVQASNLKSKRRLFHNIHPQTQCQMTSVHNSSGLKPQCQMTSVHNSSGLKNLNHR
ncbi:hypothetical protein Tco_0353571 [Tanacetum coccineum]